MGGGTADHDTIDQGLKLRDYDATARIQYYVLISQDEQRAMVYTRDGNGRLGIQSAGLIEGADASIELPASDVEIAFPALYEGIQWRRDGSPRHFADFCRGEE
jgi:Uma2 family endonuclease